MSDIENRSDIELLVTKFYRKVLADDLIGYLFTEIVQLDWDQHMPTMYDFWESTLLYAGTYKGNPMTKHLALNRKEPLTSRHFDRWLSLWEKTVNENFSGPKATEAVQKANQIATLMKYKIEQDLLFNPMQ